MNYAAAAHEYYSRPKDERFPTIDALIANAETDRAASAERSYTLGDLRANVVATSDGKPVTIELASPRGAARLSHWAFGQLARMVGAPAAYLRELPPDLTAAALNFGIEKYKIGADKKPTTAALLVKAPTSPDQVQKPLIRSITSTQYDRVWDADLYRKVQRNVLEHGSSSGGDWTLPATWTGEPAGAYRGDRDSFLIVTNGGSIVEDPSLTDAGKDGRMYRGLLVRNSEVGASSLQIERILFRFICGNHMLWGAIIDQSFRRRHVGSRTLQDTTREISRIAYDWANASPARDEAIIRGLINTEIAHTKDDVIAELRKLGASKDVAEQMYATAERTEPASPRSFWGAVQGLTRMSQEEPNQDDRYMLDQLAMAIATRGRAKIAV